MSVDDCKCKFGATSGRLKSYESSQPLESRIGRLCARQELRFVRFELCKTYIFFFGCALGKSCSFL